MVEKAIFGYYTDNVERAYFIERVLCARQPATAPSLPPIFATHGKVGEAVLKSHKGS